MPNLIVVLVLAMIRAVQIFDEVFVLTGGGPGSATTFIVQFIYETGFAEQIRLYGLAAAASLVLAVGLMVLTLVQLQAHPRERGGPEGALAACSSSSPARRGRTRLALDRLADLRATCASACS